MVCSLDCKPLNLRSAENLQWLWFDGFILQSGISLTTGKVENGNFSALPVVSGDIQDQGNSCHQNEKQLGISGLAPLLHVPLSDTQYRQNVKERMYEDGKSQKQLRNVRERKTEKMRHSLPGSVYLTLLCPSANSHPIPSTPDGRSWFHLSFGPNWMNGKGNVGSIPIQCGSHLGCKN